jgi:2-polyprenyl-3-methyl-5-hydroxy-6-metoxy-1,4-benzoquinol methylase
LGKGMAIQTALKEATGEYVVIQDADLEYDPSEIMKLVRKAEEEDLLVVFGSRDLGIKNRYLYPHYYWGSKSLCFLMNLVFKEKFTDPETCYKLVQTDLMRFMGITERGFGVEMEMAAKIARLRIPYGEVSITYNPRSFAEGKKIRAKDGVDAIFLIWKYWYSDLHYGIVDRILRKLRTDAALGGIHFSGRETVYDLGCGRQASMGWNLRTKIKNYVGIDSEVPNVRIDNIRLENINLEKTFKTKEKADVVVGTAILEHLTEPDNFMKSVNEMLKPGGIVAITTPAPPMADIILKIMVKTKLILADEIFDHEHYYSLDQIEILMKKHNLITVKKKAFSFGLNNLFVARKSR